ncbi:MAG: lysylphosphatidylglycerol synthase transmembrane domain-containing protein, partial [Planctomycetota bacterium]
MKKFLITLLKIGIPVAILAYLFWQASHDDAFKKLQSQYREFGFDWGLLVAAWACCATAVLITLVRWHYLVRALEIPLSLNDALRIGLMGYLFKLAPMGIVGGDLLKAVMLAQRQRERRAQAFATVAADRVIGLYMLFVVASVAIVLTDFVNHHVREIRVISWGTLAMTVVATMAIVALFIPGASGGRITRSLSNMRYVGPSLQHLIEAMRMYRRKVHVLIVAAAMSVGVHSLFTMGIYLITIGFY